MKILNVHDAIKKINIYLKRDDLRPYFIVADSVAACRELKKNFAEHAPIYISDFCAGDFFMDMDSLVDELNSLESDALVFGLGEYIYFTEREDILRTLQDKYFGRKVIFVCRGIANFLERLVEEDSKFCANNICRIAGKENFSVVKYGADMNVATDAENFSEFLKLLERGNNFASVKSDLPLLHVKEIKNFYDALKERELNFTAAQDSLNEEQWQEYFFDDNCEGYPPEHWRSFAAGFKNKISNPYLNFVFARSANFEEYRRNLFFALFDVADEKLFEDFYSRRKAIVKNISAQYLGEYLERAGKDIKYLTDNTAQERRAMIKAAQGKEKIPSVLEKNYPALKNYLEDYDFGDEEITTYFRRYKKIKLCNVDDDNFKAHVQELAIKRPYNRFETRRAILDRADKTAKLYWADALGVEFLSYITARANELGLAVKIEIARAELPTLTNQNKNFFDEWRGDKFDKNSKLDDLKHSPEKFDAPTYIDDELGIVADIVDEIKNSLTSRDAEKIILTSDHGASRLAVIYGRENKYRLNSVGEHSGRCCPINELDEKPDCATEENGYWVLANYDRFAGGRLASLEVHGGATLEEILVPVIEFMLQDTEDKISAPIQEKIPTPLKNSDDGFDFFD